MVQQWRRVQRALARVWNRIEMVFARVAVWVSGATCTGWMAQRVGCGREGAEKSGGGKGITVISEQTVRARRTRVVMSHAATRMSR